MSNEDEKSYVVRSCYGWVHFLNHEGADVSWRMSGIVTMVRLHNVVKVCFQGGIVAQEKFDTDDGAIAFRARLNNALTDNFLGGSI